MRAPSKERLLERRQRARRRLALIVIAILAIGVMSYLSLRILRNQKEVAKLATKPLPPVEPEVTDAAAGEEVEGEVEDEMAGMPMAETMQTATAELWGPPDPFTRYEGILQPGDTVGEAFDASGMPVEMSQRVIQTLKGVLDFRRVRPQDKFSLLADDQGKLLEFRFARGIDEVYSIKTTDDKWVPLREKREFSKTLALVQGNVDTTLFEAIAAAGERPDLIMSFVEIFAWAIDFSIFTRKGDTFTILCEKLFDQGTFVGYGRIYAAQYVNQGQSYDATYFESPDGFTGYFDKEGINLRRAFLRAPLRFNAITSSFTHSRFHPVLKFRRPHLGIDYAAPTGTPIWSVADGVVTGAGWMGGSGRAVKLRHRNGIETSYSHLSRIAAGIKPGHSVRQKQIIGYVGSSGMSTGPHLHFGMKIRGVASNPAKVKLPVGDPVPRKYLVKFHEERNRWQAELATLLAAAPAKLVPASAPR